MQGSELLLAVVQDSRLLLGQQAVQMLQSVNIPTQLKSSVLQSCS